MDTEHIDARGDPQGLTEKLKELTLGVVPNSIPGRDKLLLNTDDKLKEGKYGDCYIFDYQKYKWHTVPTRPGSENDVARLKHDFTSLNFNVHSNYLNLTKEETLNVLKEAAGKDHTHSKYFVCCFLTHGREGKLLMYDKFVKIDDILEKFTSSACEKLSGKPKIFIFQACRGVCCEEGVPMESTDFGSIKNNPDYQDFLVAYSTYQGKVSFKTKDPHTGGQGNHGSYFIDELCRTLEQFSNNLDLLQMLTIVNYRVAYLFQGLKPYKNKKQMPGFASRLRMEVKFNRAIQMFRSSHTEYFDYRRSLTSLGVRSTEKPLSDQKLYNILKYERIKFLLLSNERDDSEKDLSYCLSNLWSSVASKGCQREAERNWSEAKLMNFLEEVAGRDYSNTDCLICFISCKAKGDYLYDVKGNRFNMQKIVEKFTGEKCSSLVQKPKIFIFMLSSPPKKSWWPCVSAESTDGDDSRNLIPVHADILEIAATFQNSEELVKLTEKFCALIGSSEDFLSDLTKINSELAGTEKSGSTTFCFYSTLTKTLILNNKKDEK